MQKWAWFCVFSSAITSRLFLRSYIFVKRNVHCLTRRGVVAVHFLLQSQEVQVNLCTRLRY